MQRFTYNGHYTFTLSFSNLLHIEFVTDGPCFETRSVICSAVRQAKLHFDELLINLLELRAKRMLVFVWYIGAFDPGLVPMLGLRTKRLLTLREYRHCCCYFDNIAAKRVSAYAQLRVSNRTVTLIPCKQRYALQISAIALNTSFL